MKLIAFTGAPRVGKSEASDYMVRTGDNYVKHTIARGLYEEVANAFHVTVAQLCSDEWKRGSVPMLALEHCRDPEFQRLIQELETPERPGVKRILDGCILDKARSSRFILQRWASEYRRAQNPRYWVNQFGEDLRLDLGKNIAVCDLREDLEAQFLEEYATMHGYSTLIINIESWRNLKTNHSSDNGVSAQYIDATVQNNGELEEMFAQIEVHLKGKVWHPQTSTQYNTSL